ncbi:MULTISPECIES: ABC transporter permease [unclassified Saccharopolyspora]|uniref:ABC transporter permease n=1 Tax=unclassified Saccharopolyspora TaxID=2646250 RepID=UPI001CD1A79E|nr:MULTISPECIES: ABC transporter permease [unclassified Saccharopolyspora]MCA1187625.1 ABC transporter permease [Saccharopolyspora sp. 6T]MCA1278840.1 ABC transporter permease [Saccharopolyspora sp. 7B]
MSIPGYIARRVLLGFVQVLLVMVVVFFLIEALPGDAAVTIAGDDPDPAVIALLRGQLGLNAPVWERLGGWMLAASQGDFGRSLVGPRSVLDIIGSSVGPTLLLAALTLALIVPVSLGLGVLAANREGRLTDRLITSTTLGLYSVPEFAMGILLVTVFAVQLGWLPPTAVGGGGLLSRPAVLVLPVLVLLLRPICSLSRLVRAGMIDALRSGYVQQARRAGLSPLRVQFAHALPNAVVPAVQQLARTTDWLIGGVIVVEAIFVIPGLGTTLIDAVSARDLPVVQGLSLVLAVVTVLVNLVADIVARILAPAAEDDR